MASNFAVSAPHINQLTTREPAAGTAPVEERMTPSQRVEGHHAISP